MASRPPIPPRPACSSPRCTSRARSCSSSRRSTRRRRCSSTGSGAKDYRAVYVDLQSASVAGSKVFVQDQGADGLVARPSGDQPADSWDEEDKTVAFDGDWKKAKMAEAEYMQVVRRRRRSLRKMLSMLLAQAKRAEGGIVDCDANADRCSIADGDRGVAIDYELPQLGAWLSGRASPSHGGGQWFESTSAHQLLTNRLQRVPAHLSRGGPVLFLGQAGRAHAAPRRGGAVGLAVRSDGPVASGSRVGCAKQDSALRPGLLDWPHPRSQTVNTPPTPLISPERDYMREHLDDLRREVARLREMVANQQKRVGDRVPDMSPFSRAEPPTAARRK